MAGVFDGVAGVLTGVFGAPVVYQPKSGAAPVTISAVFRRRPILVQDQSGGDVWVLSPTMRVRRDLLPAIARGDLVQPSTVPGKTFRVLNRLPDISPAADGFLMVELEEVEED